MRNRSKSYFLSAFSLIELMIVIAIIGILAAIAIPSYQNYMMKSRVAEMLEVGDAAKTVVAEFISTHGGLDNVYLLPGGCSNLNFPIATTANVGAVSFWYNCTIEVDGGTATAPTVIYLSPNDPNSDGSLVWNCKTYPIRNPFAPSSCPAPTNG